MSSQKIKKLGIAGAGAFGTALAISYSKEFEVTLFTCFDEHVESMRKNNENKFLTGFEIPASLKIDNLSNLGDCEFDYILWTFPVKPTFSILNPISSHIKCPVIICSKGLVEDCSFIFDSFSEILPNSLIGYLSGPNFAIDLASYKLSCADIGALKIEDAKRFEKELSNKYLRLYSTDDVIGLQIAGAVKNVIAIACGIARGLDLGQDTTAALLTLGLLEMKNLGVELGAKEKTFCGFAGVGDLVLTSSSETSRNASFGKNLAQGGSIDSILKSSNAVCEGYHTAKQIKKLAHENNVYMPICEAVCGILFEGKDPESILNVFN